MFFEAEWRGKLLQMKDFGAAIDSVKFSSKSELSSRIFGRLKFPMGFEYLSLKIYPCNQTTPSSKQKRRLSAKVENR